MVNPFINVADFTTITKQSIITITKQSIATIIK